MGRIKALSKQTMLLKGLSSEIFSSLCPVTNNFTFFETKPIYMPPVISKLPGVGTTIFTVMSSLAKEYHAVNLGQGFPDLAMNEALIAKVNEAMLQGYNQYTHMNGYVPLREVLAEKIHYLYGASINPDTGITITPGGTYAIYTVLTSVLQPGDEVIVFQPGYDSYIPNVLINGAIPVLIPLRYPGYTIDWEAVRSAVTTRTRMIMLNSPHNPTGAILRQEDIAALRSIVSGTGLFILSDEVYEHVIFDEMPHLSMLRYPDLMERSFVCFSFGKIYHCTGWKIGYCVAPAAAMQEFRKVHSVQLLFCRYAKAGGISFFFKAKRPVRIAGKFHTAQKRLLPATHEGHKIQDAQFLRQLFYFGQL